MKITIVGTGYVGLVTGTCFAEMGTDVTCVDIDTHKIEKLKQGIIPIYEPGLEELVVKNAAEGRLHFSTSLADCLGGTEVVFSAVGTPPDENGEADLKYVLEVAQTVGSHASRAFTLVTKSTVPVGTALKVKQTVRRELERRNLGHIEFDVVSNPEFLKEGTAIKDFMNPDRVVIGVDTGRAREIMERLYKPFTLNGYPVLFMDVASAEMTKYAANGMLATRISFMNEIANLCEAVGADIDMVRKGIGADARIGGKFLYAGIGYGGSCFPKDVKALYNTGKQNGCGMALIEAVERVNEQQKTVPFQKLDKMFGHNLRGKIIAIWGLSFKPETDDMREAPSLVLIEALTQAGALIRAFDPAAMKEARRRLGDKITCCNDMYEAVTGADAVVLMAEWKQFRLPDWQKIQAAMNGNVVIDGRNIYDARELREAGFRYSRIGKKTE